jgi:hypothetical protein
MLRNEYCQGVDAELGKSGTKAYGTLSLVVLTFHDERIPPEDSTLPSFVSLIVTV